MRVVRHCEIAIVIAVLALPSVARGDSTPVATPARETFSVTYGVDIASPTATTATVRWELAGIDEIERVRLRFDPERFANFEGSGVLERRRGEIVWTPNGPYAHLTYRATLRHRRAPDKGFDSYIGDGWVVSRTSDLFPRSAVLFRRDIEPEPESRARLVFQLPRGWDVVTVMPPAGPRQFVVESRGRFDHPRGWLILGRFHRTDATVHGTAVTIAGVPGAGVPPDRILGLLDRALPIMDDLLGARAQLLIVIGADPMWRGGLSGEDSFYMHGDRPLQTPDRTSPYLHELFHMMAPFRPAWDAHWLAEGLAEFYSIEVQRRIGVLDDRRYTQALGFFARYGLWGHDFTRDQAHAIHNHSAPLVLYALDRRIRRGTDGAHGLDDVVRSLAHEGGVVTTARFLGTVRRVTGKNYGAFFRRHVYQGEIPPLPDVGIGPDAAMPSPAPRK